VKINIKKILAKEGLILILVGVLVYLSFSFLLQKAPVVYPKYKVKFANSQIYTIDIYPDINYSKVFNSRSFLQSIHNPPPALISKRIKEFSARVNINSPVEEEYCVNNWQLYLSAFYSRVLSLSLFIKVLLVYLFLLLIRFILWALKTLKNA